MATNNPKKHRTYMRQWTKRHPERAAQYNQKRRERGVGVAYALRTRYGLTVQQRDAMLAAQNGKCAICEAPEPGWKHNWTIDHCHRTGKLRQILCHSCNIVLGRVKDSPATLQKMIDYLQRHGAVTP